MVHFLHSLSDISVARTPGSVDEFSDSRMRPYCHATCQLFTSEIQAAVKQAVDDYILWQREKLGRDIDPSKLYALMVKAGAEKVTVTSPALTTVDADKIAVASTPAITFGGVSSE